MNKEQFASRIFLIFEDRSLKVPSVSWVEALYEQVKQFHDGQINMGLSKIMRVTAEEWNQKYGFGGKPAIADWIEFFSDKKTFTPEKEASIEVDRIINQAEYYYGNDILFDNQYTNACVKVYGGLGKISYELFDSYNPKHLSRTWVAKELREIWLNCYDGKKGDSTPCLGKASFKKLIYVGDKDKCLALENNKEGMEL